MRIVILLLLLGLATWSAPSAAQSVPRMIQCEECAPTQMRNRAISHGQNVGGAFYVFSLQKQVILRYWVEYDSRDSMRWIATPIEPEAAAVDMFAHMLNAYDRKPNVFIAQQVFRGNIDEIGSSHDPVAISIRGPNDDAYGRFMDDLQSCMAVTACVRRIDSTLAELNLAERRARSINFSLFRGVAGGFSWQDTPPRVTVRLCNQNNDCAVVRYRDGEWKYVETRAEGGRGKKYPKNPETVEYDFANSGEAGNFQRGLDDAGASILGSWEVETVMACTSVGSVTKCEYIIVPR